MMYALTQIICSEFEKTVGRNQSETRKALHIGFDMHTPNDDQYRVVHMYLYAPSNFVYVTIQEERVDRDGKRIVEPMQILSHHDSCWRDAVQSWISKNQKDICDVLKTFSFDGWNDVLTLTEEEANWLYIAETSLRHNWELTGENPFNDRGFWTK